MMNRIATSVEADPSHYAPGPFHRDPARRDHQRRASRGRPATSCATVGAVVDRLLHQLGLDRAAGRARAADRAAAGADPVAARRRGGSACSGARMRCAPATSAASRRWSAKSKRMALRHGLAASGDRIIVTAGVPFGVPGIDQRRPRRPPDRRRARTARRLSGRGFDRRQQRRDAVGQFRGPGSRPGRSPR